MNRREMLLASAGVAVGVTVAPLLSSEGLRTVIRFDRATNTLHRLRMHELCVGDLMFALEGEEVVGDQIYHVMSEPAINENGIWGIEVETAYSFKTGKWREPSEGWCAGEVA